MNIVDRWIIGALVMALSGMSWFIVLDMKEEIKGLTTTAQTNGVRITILENRLTAISDSHAELRKALDAHRAASERDWH